MLGDVRGGVGGIDFGVGIWVLGIGVAVAVLALTRYRLVEWRIFSVHLAGISSWLPVIAFR